MARWRSRHFTVVATLGPRWVELGHTKVVVSQQHTKGYENRWVSKSQILGIVKTRKFGAPAILEPVCVVLWHPNLKRLSKPMVFKMASCGDFQNSQFWCTINFGTRFCRVLQGAAQRGGAILLHFCGSPDPFFMHRNDSFLP